jgi:hypothetical protein
MLAACRIEQAHVQGVRMAQEMMVENFEQRLGPPRLDQELLSSRRLLTEGGTGGARRGRAEAGDQVGHGFRADDRLSGEVDCERAFEAHPQFEPGEAVDAEIAVQSASRVHLGDAPSGLKFPSEIADYGNNLRLSRIAIPKGFPRLSSHRRTLTRATSLTARTLNHSQLREKLNTTALLPLEGVAYKAHPETLVLEIDQS